MKACLTLFLCAIICTFVSAKSLNKFAANGTKSAEQRIVGGINAQRYEFPFVVSYQQLNGKHLCGGAILNTQWVLTAAHCMVMSATDTRVVAGMLDQGETHPDIQILPVVQQIIHPLYPGGTEPAANDIALLRLAWSFRWTQAVQPIYLPRENVEHYGYAWVAGWGYLSSSAPVTSTRLQQAEMLLLTLTQCANDLLNIAGSYGPLDQNNICGRGAYSGYETICRGDSGSPLVQQGVIIGVTSWSLDPCGVYHAPSVYVQVNKYLAFIRYYVPGV